MLFAALLSGCNGSAGSNTIASAIQAPVRSLTVSGTGRVSLKPDIANINIGVHTERPVASEAVSVNNADTQKVIDALKAIGIAADDITTTNFSIWQNTPYSATGEPATPVYAVDNTVYVTVRDLSKLGGLLDAAVTAGANNVNSIQFDVADKTKVNTQARTEAVKAAKAQAEELAGTTGVTLGPIQTISYYDSVPGPLYQAKGLGGGGDVAASAVPINPGSMEITVTVTLTYEIK
jgi:uncharacterized protein YggE